MSIIIWFEERSRGFPLREKVFLSSHVSRPRAPLKQLIAFFSALAGSALVLYDRAFPDPTHGWRKNEDLAWTKWRLYVTCKLYREIYHYVLTTSQEDDFPATIYISNLELGICAANGGLDFFIVKPQGDDWFSPTISFVDCTLNWEVALAYLLAKRHDLLFHPHAEARALGRMVHAHRKRSSKIKAVK